MSFNVSQHRVSIKDCALEPRTLRSSGTFWLSVARNRRPKQEPGCAGSRIFTDVTRKARKLSKSLLSG